MAATLIEPTDPIEVQHLPLLIYGPPGSGKTSIAQTAADPITLDFDKGIHRSFNRRRAMRFDSWGDLVSEQQKGALKDYHTVVIDTLGALLDSLARQVVEESAKHSQSGGLSIQGWGVLGNRFGQWIRQLVAGGQDVVMVCHEEEEKDVSGSRYLRPSLPGKMAYTVVHRLVDVMGIVRYDGRKRLFDCNPTDQYVGKNMPNWDPIPVPKLEESPSFLADLMADAKARAGKTAEASAAVAKLVDHWQEWLGRVGSDLAAFNSGLADLSELSPAAKNQAWHLVKQHAKSQGWSFDSSKKAFVAKEAA